MIRKGQLQRVVAGDTVLVQGVIFVTKALNGVFPPWKEPLKVGCKGFLVRKSVDEVLPVT